MAERVLSKERIEVLQKVAKAAQEYCDLMLDNALRGESAGLSQEEKQMSHYAYASAEGLRAALEELWAVECKEDW